tara:strand:- start:4967 stop:6562 length:1596 start_codon:yes stop_codon:yes gene_type:complete
MQQKIPAILIILAISFVLIELPHLEIGLPLHSDSYDNIAAAQETISQGTIFIGDPYAPPKEKSIYFNENPGYDLETGYVVLLLLLSFFPFISLTSLPLFFPWLVSILVFLSTFILLRKLCRQDFTAFFSSLFIFFLPSTQQMLGPLFLVASSFGLILVPLLLLLGFNFLTQRTHAKELALLLIFTAFIYPPSVVISLIALFFFTIASKTNFDQNKPLVRVFAVLSILILVMYMVWGTMIAGIDPIQNILSYGFAAILAGVDFSINTLLLRQVTLENIPFFHEYLGLPLFILSIVALFYFIFREFKEKNNDQNLIFLSAIVLSILTFLSFEIGRGIIVPTERLVLFAAYFLLLTLGIFVSELIIFVKNYFSEKNLLNKIFSQNFFLFFTLLLTIIIIFSNPIQTKDLQLNIQPNEFDSLEWIENNTAQNSLILAPPSLSKAIKVFTNRDVTCTVFTRFGCNKNLNLLVSSFFFASCEEKEKIIDDYFSADYVFLQKKLQLPSRILEFSEQNCDFLNKKFEGKNTIIYKIESR